MTCASCGRRFRPKRSDSRYCAAACRQRAYRARSREDELVRELEATRLRYWRLVDELRRARGQDPTTGEAQWVDVDGNVYMHGELVGRTTSKRPRWASWGLEAAGAPFAPPPGDRIS